MQAIEPFQFKPIGIIHSCFKEKFGIPRQTGLVKEARATLEVFAPFNRTEAFRGLEEFSHLWVMFVFHECIREQWQPTVRPPRLGGNKRMGVFATRSTFRPNPIGLSAVELEGIETEATRIVLHLKGIDFLDGTPVLDVKPYLPYADVIEDARGGFAEKAPSSRLCVEFSEQARKQCAEKLRHYPKLKILIEQVLSIDPRPAYSGDDESERIYGIKLFDFDLRWKVESGVVTVIDLIDQNQ